MPGTHVGRAFMTGAHPSYRIVPHDPDWAPIFESERALIAAALGLPPGQVQHIGSTAVPGLGAKPIVDVMVGVEEEAAYPRYVALLAPLGYEYRGETVPGTLYNRKQGPPRVNAHLCVLGGEFWSEHLLFRDYLRANPATAGDYEALKRRILDEVGQDPPAYNAAKEGFIRGVILDATQTSGTKNPSPRSWRGILD
ncbi:MAG: GrpB family protein [Dehalococcoidia bacterium]|uniref:GrpB family protein n=1 Tax=Candidatus Amarobacter glycogenicus TaxID=3140699 RepID=UPI003136F78A|nr:GrpB family protein [Dehalococcoidia bacterium]MBK7127563.1 GrpB family protein [Dehalococcoidia bacterium]MBK8560126.1 GrpB family protein [Dehalococcoidia bacterium]